MKHWLLAAALACAPSVFAHEGHDHGAPAPAAPAEAAPRVEAVSDRFQVVAELQAQRLLVHLDSYADNAPVSGARIEIESGAYKAQAQPVAPGSYAAPAGPLAAPGRHSLVLAIDAGGSADLLDGILAVPAATAAPPPAALSAPLLWSGAGLAALLVAGIGLYALRRRRRVPA